MNTEEVADKFYEIAQTGDWDKIQDELYHEDAVSIEPDFAPGESVVKGMDAIKQKGETFNEMIEEMHGGYCDKPIVAGNHFSCAMGFDATMKGMGRQEMEEIAIYEVKDGKIVKEQFFYENEEE